VGAPPVSRRHGAALTHGRLPLQSAVSAVAVIPHRNGAGASISKSHSLPPQDSLRPSPRLSATAAHRLKGTRALPSRKRSLGSSSPLSLAGAQSSVPGHVQGEGSSGAPCASSSAAGGLCAVLNDSVTNLEDHSDNEDTADSEATTEVVAAIPEVHETAEALVAKVVGSAGERFKIKVVWKSWLMREITANMPFASNDPEANTKTKREGGKVKRRIHSHRIYHRRQPRPPASGCHFLHRTASRALYTTSERLSTCSKKYMFASCRHYLIRMYHFSAAMSSAATGRF